MKSFIIKSKSSEYLLDVHLFCHVVAQVVPPDVSMPRYWSFFPLLGCLPEVVVTVVYNTVVDGPRS